MPARQQPPEARAAFATALPDGVARATRHCLGSIIMKAGTPALSVMSRFSSSSATAVRPWRRHRSALESNWTPPNYWKDVQMTTAVSNVETLKWTDKFLLGYAPMDEVHEELVEIVSQMQRASDSEIPGLLDSFITHARGHFEAEDTWMVETEFPARECHIGEHAAVMKSVEEVKVFVALGNYEICRSLAAELAGWFPGHADYLDSALAHWMCKKRLGGKPVVIRRDISLR